MSTHHFQPKRLILVRHGESEGNVDHSIYETVADGQLHLTEEGWKQARCAGQELRQIIGDEPVKFMVSPYVRTRETLNALVEPWGGLGSVRWREDPRLREQDFGNFQDVQLVKEAKTERKRFGPFFYRMPNGESPSDVFDRLSSFFESMYRSWQCDPTGKTQDLNYVIVCHGVTIGCFLMRMFKYSVDDFHRYRNFDNAEFCVLDRGGCGTYTQKALYCVKQKKQSNGVYFPTKGPRSLERDAGRLDRAIRMRPLSENAPDRTLSASERDSYEVRTFQAELQCGIRCNSENRIKSIIPDSQADRQGVVPGWYLMEVNSVAVAAGGAIKALAAVKAIGNTFEAKFRVPQAQTDKDTFEVIAFLPKLKIGIRCNERNRVESIIPNSQADSLGVVPGWRLVEIDSVAVTEGGARKALESAKADCLDAFAVKFRVPGASSD